MTFGNLKVQDLIYEDASNNEITVILSNLATKASPTFTGTVTVPTASANDNTTKAASTAYVQTELGDYLTTATATSTYAPKANPAFTGTATGVNLTLSGDLTVNGTTTTINTTTLQVEDKNIEIGKVSSPSDTTADGGGWSLLGATTKTFNWVNATDAWTSSEHIQVASGKTFIGDGSTLTALNGSNISSGTVADARISTLTASKLTGALPAISGASLTNLPPGGNTIDLVADGAIAAGKPCIITSAGKAKQVGMDQTGKSSVDSSNTPSGSTGTTYTDENCHGNESRLAYDPITKKIVLVTKGTAAGDTYAQIGTENSSNNQTIDWTTKTKIWDDNENGWYDTSDLVYAGNSRFIYVWTLNSGKSVAKIGKATSSGFSWSSAIDLYANDSVFKGFNGVKLTDDRVAFQANAKDPDGPWSEDRNGILIIDITSDTSISYRNFTQLDTDQAMENKENNTLSYDSTNGILFATWETTGGVGRCCALKVAAGTSATITKSSSNVQIQTAIGKQDACYHSGQNKFLIAYDEQGADNTEIKVATVNSTSLAVTLASGGYASNAPTRGIKIREGIDNQIFLTRIKSDLKMYMGVSTDFSGGSFTFTSPNTGRVVATTFNGGWYYFEQLFISDFGTAKNLLASAGGTTGDKSGWYTYKTSTEASNLTAAYKYIGIAESAINDTATGTIKTFGNNVTQSGLTAGAEYFVQPAGTLATSAGSVTCVAGVALSSTKLLIKQG